MSFAIIITYMKFAIVTGASTGIGKAIAFELSKHDYFIVLLARSDDKLQEIKKRIAQHGGKSGVVITDLSSIESINATIAHIKEKTDRIDLLANIAGIWHGKDEVYAGKDFETFDQQVILDTYTVGTIAPTLLAHAIIPLLPKGGKIINLSGTFENGAKGWVPYYVSKRAIEDLTIALAEELKNKDIQVNCISPSDTATESYAKYFPQYMDEAIDPALIAQKALELADPADKTTEQIIVMKKDQKPFEQFHY